MGSWKDMTKEERSAEMRKRRAVAQARREGREQEPTLGKNDSVDRTVIQIQSLMEDTYSFHLGLMETIRDYQRVLDDRKKDVEKLEANIAKLQAMAKLLEGEGHEVVARAEMLTEVA